MDKSKQFEEYRKKYPEFNYNGYKITEDSQAIHIEFEFEIPGLVKFNPSHKILKKNMKIKDINTPFVRNMVFNIGLIELISYWKAVCSPKVIIKCGKINDEQIAFWKKIYFYGLGELFYTNNITTNYEEFLNIECTGEEINIESYIDNSQLDGYIVPIGGGKDSVVTLETLRVDKNNDYCLIINPKPVTLKCAEIAGFENDNIIEIYRTIDQNIIKLNQEGFINGHTPFSAMLAFTSYFVSYIIGKKYVALSNENSANESNVIGKKINHQYSKSYEFECDFRDYAKKYLKADVEYFSFLRPLNELQIAKIFARKEKYHTTFKSCNVGSKGNEWKWCCNCAKCLFAYIILSPYLYKDKLVNIFEEDLFEREDLLDIFLELIGKKDVKPFDCVGTFEEVNYAVSRTIENINSNDLPYLLKYYKENFGLYKSQDLTKLYNEENNLNEKQNEMLRKEVFLSD